MKKELAIKQIYNDFIEKMILSDFEQEVLFRYVKNESIIKISDELNQSASTISRTIAQLKIKYNNYKKLELAKLKVLDK